MLYPTNGTGARPPSSTTFKPVRGGAVGMNWVVGRLKRDSLKDSNFIAGQVGWAPPGARVSSGH